MAGRKKKEGDSENWGGVRPNSGRPTKEKLASLNEMLNKHIDTDKVFERLMERIDSGDHRAIELFMKYGYGLPTQKIDMDVKQEGDVNITLRNLINFKDEE
jgi:hypothetical protein